MYDARYDKKNHLMIFFISYISLIHLRGGRMVRMLCIYVIHVPELEQVGHYLGPPPPKKNIYIYKEVEGKG